VFHETWLDEAETGTDATGIALARHVRPAGARVSRLAIRLGRFPDGKPRYRHLASLRSPNSRLGTWCDGLDPRARVGRNLPSGDGRAKSHPSHFARNVDPLNT
jgi:hypothetical protein